MTFLLLSFGLVAATVVLVRPAIASGAPLVVTPVNGRSVLLVFAAVVVVAAVLGIPFALALVAACIVKDIGHTIGYRLAGHDDARVRLLPLPSGPPISDRAPANDLAGFFVLLMGPGIGLAPMVAAFALAAALADTAPNAAAAARAYALAAGALNFVSLLPDGEVHACRKLPSLLGNIFDNSLEEIYHSPLAERFRAGSTACSNCRIRPVCGGCPAVCHGFGLDIHDDLDPYCFIGSAL